MRIFLVEKREIGIVSIGGTSRLKLRKIVDRLASVNNFVFYISSEAPVACGVLYHVTQISFQQTTCCLLIHMATGLLS